MDTSVFKNDGMAVQNQSREINVVSDKDQKAFRRAGFWSRTEEINKKKLVAYEGATSDFGKRAWWNNTGTLLFNPYTQISCSLGAGVIARSEDIDGLVEQAKKYGCPFIFTIRNDHPDMIEKADSLKDNVRKLMSFESWMGDYPVHLYVAIP